VAASFHSLWNKGKENTKLRFIDESNAAESYARLALLIATQHIIKAGLDIFKIEPVQEMR
jgi:arginyl-tRNA synthetase